MDVNGYTVAEVIEMYDYTGIVELRIDNRVSFFVGGSSEVSRRYGDFDAYYAWLYPTKLVIVMI